MSAYIVLPHLKIHAANALAAATVISPAPVMAAWGFAHNLGRTIKNIPEGIAIIHHDGQLLGENIDYLWRPHQRRGASFLIDKFDYSSHATHALSLQPVATCHLEWSLILRFQNANIDSEKMKKFLANACLCGGQILNGDQMDCMPVDSADEARRKIRTGYWLVDRKDILKSRPARENVLDAFIRALGTQKPGDSWITPFAAGYAAVTPFEHRKNARCWEDNEKNLHPSPHAYCETLIGLTQYVSLRHYREHPIPIWTGQWTEDGQTFFISNHHS